ncbi:hypothetical protein N7508_011144 [Penicillium antarcticum]|uniref:uncharacterized protein n=1 Tax=Penicillium antarcticum TaxID=416450 RepID=UPI002396A8E8|nr:uncharacterized protein N7508_011144 [Penicillium antarcticum]KAJ5288369.1 hypothetical protein N7508_011144 [Penicillium antarcticum]
MVYGRQNLPEANSVWTLKSEGSNSLKQCFKSGFLGWLPFLFEPLADYIPPIQPPKDLPPEK